MNVKKMIKRLTNEYVNAMENYGESISQLYNVASFEKKENK